MNVESPQSPPTTPKPTLLTLPSEIRFLIFSHYFYRSEPLRLRAPCPLPRAAPPKQPSEFALLKTCRQIHDEAEPFLYRNIHFGWLANMTKVLSRPARKAFYSRNIREATSQYDVGLIEDFLKMAACLSRLQRLILLAEVSAIHTEERQISGIFKFLRLYRDDLSSVESPLPFEVLFKLSVIDFEAKASFVQNNYSFLGSLAPRHGEMIDYPAGMVCIALRLHSHGLTSAERNLHLQH
jgi:hypothetical protein